MAAASGIWNHSPAAGQALAGATPMASSSSNTNSSSTSSSSATISANDFLTLLVTEMQNQDPTANTDPNEYINQLVNVNSLEQLISINQNLSTALGTSPTGSTAGATGASAASVSGASPASQPGVAAGNSGTAAAQPAAMHIAVQNAGIQQAPGNLSVPAVNPAAQRVAQALGGHFHAQ